MDVPSHSYCFIFFFQAEDGIRDLTVTGVQTCALPISSVSRRSVVFIPGEWPASSRHVPSDAQLHNREGRAASGPPLIVNYKDFPVFATEIGRASCRERV